MSEVTPQTGSPQGQYAVTFRELRASDLDALYFLHQEGLSTDTARTYGALQAALLEPGAGAMVAEVEDPVEPEVRRVIAAMIVRHGIEADWMVLDSVVVEPRFRKRGLGRRLVAWACRAALGQSRPLLVCLVREGDEVAQGFLEAVGFQPTDLRPPASEEGGEGGDNNLPDNPGVVWRLALEENAQGAERGSGSDDEKDQSSGG